MENTFLAKKSLHFC